MRNTKKTLTIDKITKEELSVESIEHLLLIEIDEKELENFLEDFSFLLNGLIIQVKSDNSLNRK